MGSSDPLPRGLGEWRDAVRDAERRGELLTAYDLAERALAAHPDDRWLQHRAVLALARAGSTDEARRRLAEYGLGEVSAGESGGVPLEEFRALEARLEKDVALAATGDRRREAAERAAELYGAAFASTGGYYSGINAATLRLFAGDPAGARALAAEVLPLAREAGDDPYYAPATEAEALLLLGEPEAARAALEQAALAAGGDHAAVATTRRQLRLVAAALGVGDDLLDALRAPAVAHFCGHMITPGSGGRFSARDEEAVAARVRETVAARSIAYAYGSLASGADTLWAEALLEHGAELHVVLPFRLEEFVELSVAPAGPRWVERFRQCLARASAVDYATEDAYLGDDILFRYASELAMGLAILHARHLDGEAVQLAVWDGRPARAEAGTAVDVRTWQQTGLPAVVLPPGATAAEPEPPATATDGSRRVVRALLFADVKGFSRLTDEQLPSFAEHVLGAFARVLDAHGPAVCSRNTWGDGLYVVVEDAPAAAALALDLQSALGRVDTVAVALPELSLRIGAHLGPVFPITDPVLAAPSYIGAHVSRTARIEPVTPEGSVYVTERFAAALLLAASDRFACDYVGHMPAAKDYGRLRMYRLRAVAGGA